MSKRITGHSMRVFMVGWEFPPHNSGGLGTACLGLTEGLAPIGVDIDFVLPHTTGDIPYDHLKIHSAIDFTPTNEDGEILPISQEQLVAAFNQPGYRSQAGTSTHAAIPRLAVQGQRLAVQGDNAASVEVFPHQQSAWYAYHTGAVAQQAEDFDIVHAHDWMTYAAGSAAKKAAAAKGRDVPFIAHVHATEIDRSGGNPDGGHPDIIALERSGLAAADHVVAVSAYTKNLLHKHYNIPRNKISVVHNGIPAKTPRQFDFHALKNHYKLVLFIGRLTIQKGPDYFLEVAKRVTDADPSVRFLLVGSGDMEARCLEQAAWMGLTGKVLFSTFLRGKDVDRAYQLADLFMMPSVSEPFGIVALEAMQNGTPTLVSKQSGVAEVSENVIKVDFWDIDAMTKEVLAVLNDPAYADKLRQGAHQDLQNLGWKDAAEKLVAVYNQVLNTAHAY